MARRLAVILMLLSVLAGVLPVGGWWGADDQQAAAASGCCDDGCTCCLPENREPPCPCRPEREPNQGLSVGPAVVQQRAAARVAVRRERAERTWPNGPSIAANRAPRSIAPTNEAAAGRGSVRVQARLCVWVV